MLYLLQSFDRLGLPHIHGVEFVCRWILMIQAAVRRNPGSPHFEELKSNLDHTFDRRGVAITLGLTKFMADEQRAEAQVMEPRRLLRGEARTGSERREDYGRADDGSGGSKRPARDRREHHRKEKRVKRERGRTVVGADKADRSK